MAKQVHKAYSLIVKRNIQTFDYLGKSFRPGDTVSFDDDRTLLTTVKALANVVQIVDEKGAIQNFEKTIDILQERVKLMAAGNPVKVSRKPSVSNGIVDPKTDKGEQGPGLSISEMRAFDVSTLSLKPKASVNMAYLQGWCNKLKLGRPPLTATKEEVYEGIEDYFEVIKNTKAAEEEREKGVKNTADVVVTEEDEPEDTEEESDEDDGEEDSEEESEEDEDSDEDSEEESEEDAEGATGGTGAEKTE